MIRRCLEHIKKKGILLVLLSGLIFIPLKHVYAVCCTCTATVALADVLVWDVAEDEFDDKINEEYLRLERFVAEEMWAAVILPRLMASAEEFTAVALWQVQAIGMFIDAKQQMETQLVQQEIRAEILKDYQPSQEICNFGSAVKSIAATEQRMKVNALALSARSIGRQLGKTNTADMYGNDLQNANRVNHFRDKYCDENDRNNALASVCTNMLWSTLTSAEKNFINRDIDYFRTLEDPSNLLVDFSNDKIVDTIATPNIHNEDEEDILALSTNIFGFKNFPRPPARTLTNESILENEGLNSMQEAYLDMRSIIAKRGIAENSFNEIVALKSEGSRAKDTSGNVIPMNARHYMESVLTGLGMPAADALKVLGENPSYDAQMEVLTKRMYQNPDFYTNLYETPANIKRKAVALQAIKLMQKFDMYNSYLRSEVTFSVLLELAVSELQKEIEDVIRNPITSDNIKW